MKASTKDITESSALNRVQTLLGPDAVLVPFIYQTKKPAGRWKDAGPHLMDGPTHIKALSGLCNIGVVLGAPSRGLCAIDLDAAEAREAFLACNPWLVDFDGRELRTLESRAARGSQIWFNVRGDFPPLAKISDDAEQALGEWRATGGLSILAGRHPEGMDYSDNGTEPLTVEFEDFTWPAGWRLPWRDAEGQKIFAETETGYGPAFTYRVDKKTGDFIESGFAEPFWAGLFAAENHVLYDPATAVFYQFQAPTGLWREATEPAVEQLLRRRMAAAAGAIKMPSLSAKATSRLLRGMTRQLMGITERLDPWRDRPHLVHVANGALRFAPDNSYVFDPHPPRPRDYSRNQSPLEFRPGATCPRTDSELVALNFAPDDANTFWQYAGLCLFGRNLAQRILILRGSTGGTGKSTLALLVQKLVGIENTATLRTELLAGRFELFGYVNRTLLSGIDVRADFLNRPGANVLKGLVGGDLLEAEGKFGNQRPRLRGEFLSLITSNERLTLEPNVAQDPWRRRLIVLEASGAKPPKKIPDFDQVLVAAEGSGILNRALAGLSELLADIRETGDFKLTETQAARVELMLSESQSVELFLRESVERAETGAITSDALRTRYVEYASERGITPDPAAAARIKQAMAALFGCAESSSVEGPDGRAKKGFRKCRWI